MASIRVAAARLASSFDESCAWGATPDGGMNRLSLNDDDKRVREWLVDQVKACGCTVKVDKMGNIFATRPGKNNALPPIAMGSHLDTQPAGGKYDGIVGVLSGLEVLRTLQDKQVETYAPVALVNWTNEEGARFPPAMVASGVWGGAFTLEHGHTRSDASGKTIKQELERIGFLGDVDCSFEANPLSAHFEIHIEQGPALEAEDLRVGVVTGVQSMNWYNVVLRGREQHCGTTPMDMRADTLLCAAKMIQAINAQALALPGSLASVAVINSTPQSINTLAGRVQFNIDARASSDALLAQLAERLKSTCTEIAEKDGVKIQVWDRIWKSPKTKFDENAVDMVRKSAQEVEGGRFKDMISGAGHDSVYTAKKVPTAMIFIRCKGGISHNPAEFSTQEDIQAGANVLLGAVLRYDEYLKNTSQQ
ncbi:N-carbamoyl-L-amino acid hydrolase [Gloeophyllum trabeum ATCC 11539]|uniref:N-carbamoyl-L-amino acid hydrolase n=1 Tax=Gloeophyllum trabeum (strain ATCC 11539 / FP-39264 / Madison 617) TaxID=670483 RepID=S7PSE6_GLOTA|nr:N-carbamoyl-L-amino acid hydrolase [Gloeophyllum trabeum ATCC 11539]EPQ50736.1 N-carbamoyl-L-amino acid hydrolase [Gloeophyllum trabeum ATCC 11539]